MLTVIMLVCACLVNMHCYCYFCKKTQAPPGHSSTLAHVASWVYKKTKLHMFLTKYQIMSIKIYFRYQMYTVLLQHDTFQNSAYYKIKMY